ncbi:F-box/kelch-repeat protein SKIP6-like [Raphanus sativus]|uniref:F-box/kelch-repeat protein SKIP6-like n=1 Tax=Raphanus sativus TaxID=3726 RepID=A0A9W3CA47_RAPSA|nr:F-box/kelch-repeat protein SKIP6-like [Raphanus sativus]
MSFFVRFLKHLQEVFKPSNFKVGLVRCTIQKKSHPVRRRGRRRRRKKKRARAYGAAGVVDGKIYVLGGLNVIDGNWGQVFDPKTQTWDTLPPPMPKGKIVNNLNIHASFVRDHKVYAVDGMNRTYYYSPREVKWEIGNRDQPKGSRRDWCMIDNLIYCVS